MKLRLVDTESEFDALEAEWNRLADRTSASIFSSFDYTRIAWKHFHKPTDRLFILVLSDGPSIVGIAPFYITRCKRRGISYRSMRFIAAWEGDRPGVLAAEGQDAFWPEILLFLNNECDSCEIVDLVEQAPEGPDGRGWGALRESGWYWEKSPDAIDYYIPLNGCWEDYVKSLDSHTRHEYHRKARRISSISGGHAVERISEPGRIREGLSRFIAIERQSWKADSGIGVAKDEQHILFYQDLLYHLAENGRAVLYILVGGGQDMAANMVFVQKDVVYSRHLAYAQPHAFFSPGVLLHAEVFREYFGGSFKEFDMLALREDGPPPRHKTDWCKERRETVQWTGYRTRSCIRPLIFAKRLKNLFREGTQADVACTVAEPSVDCKID
jgi:CelD/BcsL family acetyltransferase involved in cellulose biosynthesis